MTSAVIPNKTQQKFLCHSERSGAEWRISFWFTSLFLTIVEILPSSEWHAPIFLTKRSKNSTVILNAAKRSEESLFGLQVFFWQLLRFFLRQNDKRRHSQQNAAEIPLSFWTQRSGVKNPFLVYKSFFDNSWDSSFVRMTCAIIPKETQEKLTVILNAAKRSEESLFGLQVFFWQFLRFFLRQNDMRHHS